MTDDKSAPLPPLVYAVWISGRGWLKDSAGGAFADLRVEVAETAAAMYGPPAVVKIVDSAPSAMMALERIFLEREAFHAQERRERSVRSKLNGLLGLVGIHKSK